MVPKQSAATFKHSDKTVILVIKDSIKIHNSAIIIILRIQYNNRSIRFSALLESLELDDIVSCVFIVVFWRAEHVGCSSTVSTIFCMLCMGFLL